MPIFALADCNNFYTSCERVFRPDLNGKPVITLSSNDGCIISRSNEAKALGIPMGVPFFKVKEIIEAHQVQVFSSNFTLYGDMSSRVMSVLSEFADDFEIYSIDEAFLSLNGILNLKQYVMKMKATVKQYTGIPVSIGVGPSKTLAKLANHIAKTQSRAGVFALNDPHLRNRLFKKIDVKEVWGIGSRLSKHLYAINVYTIADFISLDSALVRKKFNVTVLKTQKELQGESCLSLEDDLDGQKSVISSKSFGRAVTSLEDLKASITMHVSRLGEKLRQSNQAVKQFYIYAYNSRFSTNPQKFSTTIELPYTTNSTASLLKAALKEINSIYEAGISYKKAGVYACELLPEGIYSDDLFAESENPKTKKLSQVLDAVNNKYGKHQLFQGSLGIKRDWLPKDMLRSQHYTTDYNQLLIVN